MRSEVAKQLGMRHAPSLTFIPDALPENARHLDEVLAKARAQDEEAAARRGAAYAGEADPYKKPREPRRGRRHRRRRSRRRVTDLSGLVVVDKPAGLTSHDVVARVRRLAGTRKVGHAGTLDPMATGVLVLGVNRATRLLGHLMLTEKAYDATIRLGVATTTDDAEGEIVATVASTADLEEPTVRAALGRVRRRHRAGADRGVGDQGRRQARLPAGPRRRGRRAQGPAGHHPRADGARRAAGGGGARRRRDGALLQRHLHPRHRP